MSDLIVEIILLVMLLLCCVLFGWGSYEQWQLKKANKTIEDYVEQIDKLHADSIKANTQAKLAAQKADEEVKAVNDYSRKLMKEKVSHDCQEAIKWGIQKAKSL